MFNKFKTLAEKVSGLRQAPVRAMASGNFLNAINELNQSKEVLEVKEDTKEIQYNNLLSEGTTLLKYLSSSSDFDGDLFYEIASIFTEASKLRPTKATPYFYLSWLYQYAGEIETAIKYLRISSSIDPSIEGLEELRDLISSSIVIDNKKEVVENNISQPQLEEEKKQIQSNTTTKPPPALNPLASKKLNAYKQYR